jgi:hypothetical protein
MRPDKAALAGLGEKIVFTANINRSDQHNKFVRFEVLAAASMHMAVLWNVVSYSLVEVY